MLSTIPSKPNSGFYVNLPIGGVVALAIVFIRIPDHIEKPDLRAVIKNAVTDFDLPGFALFAPAAIMLFLALQVPNLPHYPLVHVLTIPIVGRKSVRVGQFPGDWTLLRRRRHVHRLVGMGLLPGRKRYDSVFNDETARRVGQLRYRFLHERIYVYHGVLLAHLFPGCPGRLAFHEWRRCPTEYPCDDGFRRYDWSLK